MNFLAVGRRRPPKTTEAARTSKGPQRLHERDVPNSCAAPGGLIGVPGQLAGPHRGARLLDERGLDRQSRHRHGEIMARADAAPLCHALPGHGVASPSRSGRHHGRRHERERHPIYRSSHGARVEDQFKRPARSDVGLGSLRSSLIRVPPIALRRSAARERVGDLGRSGSLGLPGNCCRRRGSESLPLRRGN